MIERLKFPNNFLWGSATSSHQVEGNNNNNDWWKWELEGKTKDPSGKATNQYELFRNDFKLAHSLNHNAHRFSLEWSRIEPEEGKFSRDALNHYKEMIRTLRSLGMTPVVTINHFSLPLWFTEKGGWLGERSEHIFARLSEKVAEELGRDVEYWITVNEPVAYINGAYIVGDFPPGRQSFKEAARATVRILRAHCLAYKAIHKVYKEKGWPTPKVSISKFTIAYTPCRPNSKLDILSTRIRHYYANKLFIDALVTGWCKVPGMPLARLPLAKSLDYIGFNYYTRDYIHFEGFSPSKIFGTVCSQSHHKDSGKRSFLGWEIYPEGMYNMLMEFSKYGLPIMITENGVSVTDDNVRIDFIKAHLKQVHRAIKDGAPIFGYLHWSLLDNFEWTDGFGPRFGIIEVDYATQRRTIKPSARILADIIKTNAL